MTPDDVANRLLALGPVELPAIETALRLAEMAFTGAPGSVEERVILLDEIETEITALEELGNFAGEVGGRCLKLRAMASRTAAWF